MEKFLLIGFGGFAGVILRYGVSGFFQNQSKSVLFPYGTLTANVLGCFLIGGLSQLADTRAFIFIGLLGAFTTFSTFGSETVNLIVAGKSMHSLANIGLQLGLGLGAVWLGRVRRYLYGGEVISLPLASIS